MSKLRSYISLTRLDRPVGIYLVLWPALWALWLASDGMPSLYHLFVFIFGAVLMRSAGCVINDYADRHFDGHVERTCNRPLATGEISAKEALVFFSLLCFIAFLLVLTLNTLTVILSLGAVLLATLYPFMKRHTYWPQAFLGAAFAWAIPMAFSAVQNEVPWQVWPIFVATMIWSLIYDTAYAVGDMKDDLKIGVKSTAILFADKLVPIIGLFQIIMIGLLIWIGSLFSLGSIYYTGLVIVATWFLYDLMRLNRKDDALAFKVFIQNHWIGLIVLVSIAFDLAIQV
ncbi:4-hydroxybenzoate octaprenyltransferase [Thiomicrorhabdus lithotrophica]|uniref:4-hydroxybenzoate octaprenyltransferase n=1 Tax=Thiomicrorhabdus lithotrophica TaxID=2949997 RepID=A0ABY8CDL7_9GAMM|nr:4-hydroxybenzoate octaprenyltransferase [Thiomicrorhabdus lithotrophica]WEJ62611.1 4-hydroxybenzoate octaprenyltransferase [Thiomicrorhabdus lithotrophica]